MNDAILQISDREYALISALMARITGVQLGGAKRELVMARLNKRVRALGLSTYAEYISLLEKQGAGGELQRMIDELTTHKTSFFREAAHFDFLRAYLLEHGKTPGVRLRLWSAGCSTGEEAYTLAFQALDALPGAAMMDVRILGTDVSSAVLAKAREAHYPADLLGELSPGLVRRFFEPDPLDGQPAYRVKAPVRSLVSFASLNLLEPWPMRGLFDAIFCRNVMIYFGPETRQQLVTRFARQIKPGGFLCVGHAESLGGLSHDFTVVQPAVYRKAVESR